MEVLACVRPGFLFGKALISWETRKQKTVALPSNEAKYMAMSDASRGYIFEISLFGAAFYDRMYFV